MMIAKALLTARAFWVSKQAALEALEAAHCTAVLAPHPGPLWEEETISLLQGCDAVLASNDPYNARVFAACPQLQVVSRCGVGIDQIDLKAATDAGVVVTNTPAAITEAVADFAFGMLLSVARNISASEVLLRSGEWSPLGGVLVWGKTLGLVGLGRIGQAVARRAMGFGMQVLAYDPVQQERGAAAPDASLAVSFVELDDLLARSDFVSVHAPATPETAQMFNAARFARMKPTAYLINTARGALVDEPALLSALETGQIAGAALDVFAQEPLPSDHPLRHAPHCLLTPHCAFNAIEAADKMARLSVENLLMLARGERPVDVCNPDVWQSPTLRLT